MLRRLLSSDGSLTETVVVLPEDLVITDTANENGGDAGLTGLVLNGPTVFDVFDTHITAVNQLRRALRIELDDARASLGEAGQTNVSVLLLETRSLGLGWGRFHDGYDEWRRTNCGCDQGGALEALGQLARGFGQPVRDIQELPTVPLVRGMGEELLQAAEREQAAVQSLRETWRSLDTSAFGRYSADRSFAESLRRQTALDLQDLLERQGIDSGS